MQSTEERHGKEKEEVLKQPTVYFYDKVHKSVYERVIPVLKKKKRKIIKPEIVCED